MLAIPNCQAEGVTRQQALDRVQQNLSRSSFSCRNSAIEVQLDASKNPLMKFVGIFEEDPFFAEIAKEISLDYSPTCETLTATAPQKTDCFLGKSSDSFLSRAFEDFCKSS